MNGLREIYGQMGIGRQVWEYGEAVLERDRKSVV